MGRQGKDLGSASARGIWVLMLIYSSAWSFTFLHSINIDFGSDRLGIERFPNIQLMSPLSASLVYEDGFASAYKKNESPKSWLSKWFP
jgi:hypothetical protein